MISHEYKFIFVHTSRTGGTSLERLAGVEPTQDQRTADYGNTDFPEKHQNFAYYHNRYPEEFANYFKFTIVRNPYDRLVSGWHWICSVVKGGKCSLKAFALTRPENWSYQANLKLDNRSFEESVAQLDYIARFETLQEDAQHICSKTGLDFSRYPHANQTQHQPYWKYYDDETRDLVTRQFKKDIEYFGYRFGA